MKWQAVAAGALASALLSCVVLIGSVFTSSAFADVRIVNDLGGEVSSYVEKFQEMRAAGDRVVIDGPCLSACTLLTGIIPRDKVCVTSRAALGFHAASYYDDASRSLVPTKEGSRVVMRLYPPAIKAWIGRHGGLTPTLMFMRGRELAALYPTCH
ncbi:MAG: hypothetical protein WBQ24_00955 [Xanthobacteraceae bacterium]|jgi:hypothetical protein